MRIAFMGSPEFACPSLEHLCQQGQRPVLVVTQPQARRSRRGGAEISPVGKLALSLGLDLLETANVSVGADFERLAVAAPDLIVVVAFGQILRKKVLKLAPLGCINVHPSALPQYRGAAPVQSAILDGVTDSAVTIMRLVREMDAGPILKQVPFAISPDETAAEALNRAAIIGAHALADVVAMMAAGNPPPAQEQRHSEATFSRKLSKEDGLIDFTRTATEVWNQIRGVTPWPGAAGMLKGQRLMIHRAKPREASPSPVAAAGTIIKASPDEVLVACGSGWLELIEVQFEGKPRILATAAVNGQRLKEGMVFEPAGKPLVKP